MSSRRQRRRVGGPAPEIRRARGRGAAARAEASPPVAAPSSLRLRSAPPNEYMVPPTADKLRNRGRAALAKALSWHSDKNRKPRTIRVETEDKHVIVGNAIEEAVYRMNVKKNGDLDVYNYKGKLRKLMSAFNNESNHKMRESVLTHKLLPSNVAALTVEELMCEHERLYRIALEHKNILLQMAYDERASEVRTTPWGGFTKKIECPKCGGRWCKYRHRRLNYGDPCTTATITCVLCGHGWEDLVTNLDHSLTDTNDRIPVFFRDLSHLVDSEYGVY